jgi:hypothetical protein
MPRPQFSSGAHIPIHRHDFRQQAKFYLELWPCRRGTDWFHRGATLCGSALLRCDWGVGDHESLPRPRFLDPVPDRRARARSVRLRHSLSLGGRIRLGAPCMNLILKQEYTPTWRIRSVPVLRCRYHSKSILLPATENISSTYCPIYTRLAVPDTLATDTPRQGCCSSSMHST